MKDSGQTPGVGGAVLGRSPGVRNRPWCCLETEDPMGSGRRWGAAMLPVFLLRAQRGSSQVRCSAGLRVHPIIRGRGPGVPVPPLEPEGAGPGRGRPAGLRARLGFPVSSLRCLCFNSKGLSGPGDPVEPPEGPHPNLSFPKPRSDTERPAARAPLRPRMETRPRSSCCVRGRPRGDGQPLPQSISDSQGAPSELIMLCCIKPIS